MELYKHLNNTRRDSLLLCDPDYLLQMLQKTYCICPLVWSPSPRATRDCTHGSQNISSTPNDSKVSSIKNSAESVKTNPTIFIDPQVKEHEEETNIIRISLEESQPTDEESKNDLETVRAIRQRRNRSLRLDITDKLTTLRSLIINNHVSPFRRSSKKTRFTKNKYLGRRSKYIGVTKNNVHWQALINVNHAKKYIGTFIDEIEAAQTYDLFALAMQGRRARLNFNYPPQKMVEMIDQYLAHGRITTNN